MCNNKKSRFINKNEGSGLLSSLGIRTPLNKIPGLNMHLWDPKVKKYSACGPFTKHQKRIDMFMKEGRLSHILKNRLDAVCFQHDSAYEKYKDSK